MILCCGLYSGIVMDQIGWNCTDDLGFLRCWPKLEISEYTIGVDENAPVQHQRIWTNWTFWANGLK